MIIWSRSYPPLLALSAVLALGAIGCTANAPPPGSKPDTPQPASPVRPVPALPARPAVLPVDKVEPCALLNDAQVRQLKVEPGRSHVNTDELPGPDCLWSSFPANPDRGWLAQPLPTRGADNALHSTTGAQIVQVAGFPAVQTTSPYTDPRSSCLLFVDTAPGQSLLVQFESHGDEPEMTHERACQNAAAGAEMMIQNLRALVR
jgi:hypothetical protein